MVKRFLNRRKTCVVKCKEGLIKFIEVPINVSHKTILTRTLEEVKKINSNIKSLHHTKVLINDAIEEFEGDYYILNNIEVQYNITINWKKEY